MATKSYTHQELAMLPDLLAVQPPHVIAEALEGEKPKLTLAEAKKLVGAHAEERKR